jgi:hypothetical protein
MATFGSVSFKGFDEKFSYVADLDIGLVQKSFLQIFFVSSWFAPGCSFAKKNGRPKAPV